MKRKRPLKVPYTEQFRVYSQYTDKHVCNFIFECDNNGNRDFED